MSVTHVETTRQALTIIEPMDADEARAHVQAVNNAAADMGRRLLELRERQGWRALGYATWTACLEHEFRYSRQYLYELMTAAPVLERLSTIVDKLSTKAAKALAQFEPDLQSVIVRTAQARYGKLTESNLTRVGDVVQTMARTGHVDLGNGASNPVDGALDAEDDEAIKRRKQYIADNSRPTVDSETGEIVIPSRKCGEFPADVIQSDSQAVVIQADGMFRFGLTVGERYFVKVYAL